VEPLKQAFWTFVELRVDNMSRNIVVNPNKTTSIFLFGGDDLLLQTISPSIEGHSIVRRRLAQNAYLKSNKNCIL